MKVVLVAGYSGVGKTSLVSQLKDIKEHAYLISGKYDFSKRDVPYSAVVSAFTDMVHQVLLSRLTHRTDTHSRIRGLSLV
jgi:predicted ATPase